MRSVSASVTSPGLRARGANCSKRRPLAVPSLLRKRCAQSSRGEQTLVKRNASPAQTCSKVSHVALGLITPWRRYGQAGHVQGQGTPSLGCAAWGRGGARRRSAASERQVISWCASRGGWARQALRFVLRCGRAADAAERLPTAASWARRFKLNCCCTSWRGALLHAPHVWDTVVIDPRRRGSTTRRRKLKTQLPTPVAVLAWWRTYGRHVVRLYARALDAETASAGCLGAATHLTQLLAASVPSLQLVSLHGCELGGAVGEGLCSLSLLTALELQAPASQTAPWARVVPWLGSGLPALEELALSAPQPANGPQCLPDTLSRLSRLRVLAVAGASARAGHRLRLDAQLLALTALQEMALENHVLEAVTTSSQTGVTAVEAVRGRGHAHVTPQPRSSAAAAAAAARASRRSFAA